MRTSCESRGTSQRTFCVWMYASVRLWPPELGGTVQGSHNGRPGGTGVMASGSDAHIFRMRFDDFSTGRTVHRIGPSDPLSSPRLHGAALVTASRSVVTATLPEPAHAGAEGGMRAQGRVRGTASSE